MRAHILEAPFSDRPQLLTVLGLELKVLPFEALVWISLTSAEMAVLPEDAPRFPAVVDTGHASSLSIKQDHLGKLIDPTLLPIFGAPAKLVYADGRKASVPRFQARIWLHGFHPDPTNRPRAQSGYRHETASYATAQCRGRNVRNRVGIGFGVSWVVPCRWRYLQKPMHQGRTFRSGCPSVPAVGVCWS